MVYVIISTQIWSDNWVSKHWIAHYLAEKGNDVYFVEPLRAVFLPGRKGKFTDFMRGPSVRKEGKVKVVSISVLPFYYKIPSIFRVIWRLLLKRQFKNLNDRLVEGRYICMTFDGRSLPFVRELSRPKRLIYYSVDPVSSEDWRWPEWMLIKQADRVLVISEPAKKKLEEIYFRDDICVVPHGIDYYGSAGINERSENSQIRDGYNAVVGYTGSIHDVYVDFEKIYRLALEQADWKFVFVGPYKGSDIAEDAGTAINKLFDLDNVEFIGSRPYWELKKYIAEFDVCLIPYRADIENGWERRSPVKILHYLAQGKPVVCSDVPAAEEYKELIYIYRNYKEFAEMIRLGIEEDGKELSARRKSFARERDCGKILGRIEELI